MTHNLNAHLEDFPRVNEPMLQADLKDASRIIHETRYLLIYELDLPIEQTRVIHQYQQEQNTYSTVEVSISNARRSLIHLQESGDHKLISHLGACVTVNEMSKISEATETRRKLRQSLIGDIGNFRKPTGSELARSLSGSPFTELNEEDREGLDRLEHLINRRIRGTRLQPDGEFIRAGESLSVMQVRLTNQQQAVGIIGRHLNSRQDSYFLAPYSHLLHGRNVICSTGKYRWNDAQLTALRHKLTGARP